MKVRLLIFLTSLISLTSFGQAPIINNIQPSSTHPGNALLITGSGFNSSTTQMQVWFDQVKGTITAASEFSIEVIVPAQARMSNVEVINLTSGLSAKSLIKFVPFYSGTISTFLFYNGHYYFGFFHRLFVLTFAGCIQNKLYIPLQSF